jgi:hypothetical protein
MAMSLQEITDRLEIEAVRRLPAARAPWWAMAVAQAARSPWRTSRSEPRRPRRGRPARAVTCARARPTAPRPPRQPRRAGPLPNSPPTTSRSTHSPRRPPESSAPCYANCPEIAAQLNSIAWSAHIKSGRPLRRSAVTDGVSPETRYGQPPRALNKRLVIEAGTILALAYASGVNQR